MIYWAQRSYYHDIIFLQTDKNWQKDPKVCTEIQRAKNSWEIFACTEQIKGLALLDNKNHCKTTVINII